MRRLCADLDRRRQTPDPRSVAGVNAQGRRRLRCFGDRFRDESRYLGDVQYQGFCGRELRNIRNFHCQAVGWKDETAHVSIAFGA